MQKEQKVDVFWDFETARVKSQVSGYRIAERLRDIANSYGLARSIRVYLDVSKQSHPKFSNMRAELHSSGISLIDCPSTSKKDVADKAMIVDMLSLVVDETPPHTVVIATGDHDLAYPLAVLRLRKFTVILVHPSGTKECLLMQSDEQINWHSRVLGIDQDGNIPPSSSSSTSSSSSSPSNHSPGSYISYATPPPVNNQRSRIRTSQSDKARTNVNGRQDRPAVISPLQSAPRSAAGTNLKRPRAPSSVGSPGDFGPSLASASHKPSTVADSKPRARSSTVSAGWFFPPPPSFPLDPPSTRPPGALTPRLGETQGISAASPPPPGSVAIVDHPTREPNLDETRAAVEPALSFRPAPVALEPVNGLSAVASQVASGASLPPATNSSEGSDTTTAIPITTASIVPESSVANSLTPIIPAIPHPGMPPVADRPVIARQVPSTPLSAKDTSTKPQTPKKKTAAASPSKTPTPPRVLPVIYHPLVKRLQAHRRAGVTWPNQSQIASEVIKINPRVYAAANVARWGKYALKAVQDQVIMMEGDDILLREEWVDTMIP